MLTIHRKAENIDVEWLQGKDWLQQTKDVGIVKLHFNMITRLLRFMAGINNSSPSCMVTHKKFLKFIWTI